MSSLSSSWNPLKEEDANLNDKFFTVEDFKRKFCEVIPRDVNTNNTTWCIPKPNVTRDILSLFSTFDEEQFTGAPIPWHHKAEDSSSPKPNA